MSSKTVKFEMDQIMASIEQIKEDILDAALPHVMFDGWTNEVLKLATNDTDIDPSVAKQAFPRGALDLALFYHSKGDCAMMEALDKADLSGLRYSEKVAFAVKTRLQLVDKEAVRRGVTLFALPQYAGEGVTAIWSTVDAIWKALGDTSDDVNYYTKRATLSGVYSSTVLFWIGDSSDGDMATWEFLDRRIDNVMQFEKVKAKVKDTPLGKLVEASTSWIKAPSDDHKSNFPGYSG
ncbi:MAG: COQ9 family protein [Pseudomonadota bacterium]